MVEQGRDYWAQRLRRKLARLVPASSSLKSKAHLYVRCIVDEPPLQDERVETEADLKKLNRVKGFCALRGCGIVLKTGGSTSSIRNHLKICVTCRPMVLEEHFDELGFGSKTVHPNLLKTNGYV